MDVFVCMETSQFYKGKLLLLPLALPAPALRPLKGCSEGNADLGLQKRFPTSPSLCGGSVIKKCKRVTERLNKREMLVNVTGWAK